VSWDSEALRIPATGYAQTLPAILFGTEYNYLMNCLDTVSTITTADWINIVIASVAAITAIITLLTVNEMRKQRIHSYHPDLTMANFSFFVYKGDYDEEIKSIYLYSYKTRQEENSLINGYNELTIDINNIGFGVAKDVRWKWNFDLTTAEQALLDNDVVSNWEKGEDFLTVDSSQLNVEWTFDVDEDNQGGVFNFILPYSNENRKNEIVIPSYFISLFWLYMVKGLLIKQELPYTDFPGLELNMTYTDIHSKRLSKTFYFTLHFEFIAAPRDNVKELAKFRLEINELQK
jgi:hypothetical protein